MNHVSSEPNTSVTTPTMGCQSFLPASCAASALASGYTPSKPYYLHLCHSHQVCQLQILLINPGPQRLIERQTSTTHRRRMKVIVNQQLQEFEVDGIIEEGHPDFMDFNLLQYWQVHMPPSMFNHIDIDLHLISSNKAATQLSGGLCLMFFQSKLLLWLAKSFLF